MKVELLNENLLQPLVDCGLGPLLAFIGSLASAALHITSMTEFKRSLDDVTPACCGVLDNSIQHDASSISFVGVIVSIVAGACMVVSGLLGIFPRYKKGYCYNVFNNLAQLANLIYSAIAIIVIAITMFEFPKSSRTGAMLLLGGTVVSFIMLMYPLCKPKNKYEKSGSPNDPNWCFLCLSVFLLAIQLSFAVCYLTIQHIKTADLCFTTGDSLAGDDGTDSGWTVKPNLCEAFYSNGTVSYGSYGKLTSYCTATGGCCYLVTDG